MIKISKVEVQKNHKDRVSIFVDDEYYVSMYLDTAIKFGIKKDAEIDEEKLNEILEESEKSLALNKLTNYISTNLKTIRQARDYLNKKGFDKQVVDYAIEKLKEYNYLDDERYADEYIRIYKLKYGKNTLKAKLIERGISRNIIDDKLSDFESETEVIDKLLLKKIGNMTLDDKILSKTTRFLLSRGFSFDEVNSAIKRYKEKKNESWD